jgi:hypothetical protein
MVNSIQTYYLGTAVKITVNINIATASTATISIYDPSYATKVNAATMTKTADGVYTYIYQSATTDDDGDYLVTVSFSYGGYTALEQFKFTLVDQEQLS